MITLLGYHRIKKLQRDVDFLIPFLDLDRRYFLDPALLRFSKTPLLKIWEQEIVDFLALIHQIILSNDLKKLYRLLNTGEAQDAGFGYCEDGVGGSGMGNKISQNIINILQRSPEFIKRGFIRLEELQWLDSGIGPDRISDLTISILKRHIIKYTQKQCISIGIPMEDVRIDKVFCPDTLEWASLKIRLPINPKRISRDPVNEHPPQLLLPKEIMKLLPLFLNYDDFYGFIDRDSAGKKKNSDQKKSAVIQYALNHPEKSVEYVKFRETQTEKLFRPNFDKEIILSLEKLDHIKPGDRAQANQYRDIVADLLGFSFPELKLANIEKSSMFGDKRRDIVFENNAESGIFANMRIKHKATHIVVDAKNTENITPDDISRVADYLNDNIGRVAFIISRKKEDMRILKQSLDQLLNQDKVVLFICDEDLKRWIRGMTKIQHETGKEFLSSDPKKSISKKYSDLMVLT